MRPRLALAALVTIAVALVGIFAVPEWERAQKEWYLHFPISCSAQSQRMFDDATARLHSLRFLEAQRAYTAISQAEPNCAMAYWGIAISLLRPSVVHFLPLEDIRAAREALRSAANARTASPRERAYLAAVDLLFREDGPADWQDRMTSYEQAMGTLAAQHPEDSEATIFYALALNVAARPSDKSFQKQTRAAEILLVALGEQPRHPGISHYLSYCLTLPAGATPAVQNTSISSSVQSALAALALVAVGVFFLAMGPFGPQRENEDNRSPQFENHSPKV
jgi:hypothetical protein